MLVRKKETMKPKPKEVKKVGAWAIIDQFGMIVPADMFDIYGRMEIHVTESGAEEYCSYDEGERIEQVEIRILQPRKREKRGRL